mmetsp:Transcript_107020/g.284764  ORF Transcript_107020/g.284764 Transcript_107020/m.284764 type:complete len:540 (-) Transcript_107020:216-1835(-)
MFLDQRFSQLGRNTEMALDGLRRQLGVGIDPSFDYSQMEESRRKMKEKKEKKPPKANEDTAVSGLDQLRKALREMVGGGGVLEEEQNEADGDPASGSGAAASPAVARAAREQSRPSRAFLTTSRDDVRKLDVDAPGRFRAPPVGLYRPKDELCQPRVKGAGPGGDFGTHNPTRSRKAMEIEKEVERLKEENQPYIHLIKPAVSVELLEGSPEKLRPRSPNWDMSKSSARPDICKVAGIVYNDNTFTAGVLEGDLRCSQLKRNPSWDFAKISVAEPKMQETYFQPGQYSVNISATRERTDKKNIGFDKQRARKPLKEFIGRIEIDSRLGDNLPDRSLSRSFGMSLSRSVPLLSKEPRVLGMHFDKYSERPAFSKPVPEYHRKDDPEADRTVLAHSMTFDARDADKSVRSRLRSAEKFDRSLPREQHFKIQRSYGQDVCLQRVKDNLTRGPVSVELLTDVDVSPQLQRRVTHVKDFGLMDGREPEKRYTQAPPRNRDQGAAMKFERGVREGDSRCDVSVLSPVSGGISELRATRTFDPDGA